MKAIENLKEGFRGVKLFVKVKKASDKIWRGVSLLVTADSEDEREDLRVFFKKHWWSSDEDWELYRTAFSMSLVPEGVLLRRRGRGRRVLLLHPELTAENVQKDLESHGFAAKVEVREG